jgi:LPS export ABC transporter protein LptC
MKLHRNTIWLIPLAFFISFPLWSIPVAKFLTPRGGFDPNMNKETTDHHNFMMETVSIRQNQDGKDTALIHAATARTKPEDLDTVLLETVNAELYDDNGRITLITADNGEYNLQDKGLTLIKNVIVNKTYDKQFLYTDLLIYDSVKRTVKCPGKTRLKNEEADIDGGSLDYDINSQKYIIDNRVKCLINGFIQP